MRFWQFWLMAFLALLALGCAQPDSGKVKVVSTIYPYYEFAKGIAPDAQVSVLVPPNMEPHDYEPKPSDALDLSGADIIIYNGKMDDWVLPLIMESAKPGAIIINASEAGMAQGLFGPDPHVWMGIRKSKSISARIRDALVSKNPQNKAAYDANYGALATELDSLDAKYSAETKTFAKGSVVVMHDAYNNLFSDYGLRTAAVYEITPEVEPTPAHVAELKAFMDKNGIRTLFVEPQLANGSIVSFANDNGFALAPLDPIEIENGKTYVQRMEANLENLKSALSSN